LASSQTPSLSLWAGMRLRTADVLTAKIAVNLARVLHLLLQQLEIGGRQLQRDPTGSA
jgi:hypothetical protein